MLFRIQRKLGFTFDCNATKIVKDFYKNKFGYNEICTDTLISMQYIWGLMLRNIWKPDVEQKIDKNLYEYFINKYGYAFNKNTNKKIPKIEGAQIFIYELIHLEEIK